MLQISFSHFITILFSHSSLQRTAECW